MLDSVVVELCYGATVGDDQHPGRAGLEFVGNVPKFDREPVCPERLDDRSDVRRPSPVERKHAYLLARDAGEFSECSEMKVLIESVVVQKEEVRREYEREAVRYEG
jgi:hypothetical protein